MREWVSVRGGWGVEEVKVRDEGVGECRVEGVTRLDVIRVCLRGRLMDF